ncbi:GNAT family protein [Micromonospora sp. NPDC006766]|uniref:GNAT family N-acetyltransferase n=1 Tax=Micromonospora sp. NPDC006766 TaxID=3154778 RepID=UPI0033D5D298
MAEHSIRLRPVVEEDLAMFRRFATEPGLIGLDWTGFKDPQEPARRYAGAAGFVSWALRDFGGFTKHWEIGTALLPEWRGHGIGWRAQAMLCDYLFTHTPLQRIQAGTHPENIAEQRSLVKAGFQLEGVVRACEFRDGRWCDGYLYSRLRSDPSPR